VLVRGRKARVGRCAINLEHAPVGFSSSIHVHVRKLPARALCSSTSMHKTADLADRWARGRVDTHDENHALRALSTHKPPAISKPAQTACALSRGEVPKSASDDAPFGCVGPYLALRTPLMSTPKRVSAVGSGLRASWAERRGAAGAGGAAGLVWRRCQIWKSGADLPGADGGIAA
jgi:hypothetical protein